MPQLQPVPAQPASDIETFIAPYIRYLRAEDIVQGTIDKYVLTVKQLREFLEERGHSTRVEEIQKPQIREFIVHVLERWKPVTANSKYYGLVSFFNYLKEDDEIRWHPMEGMKPPPAPAPEVPVIPDDALDALLKTCKGSTFTDRRDTAIIMVFLDTGGRASEIASLSVDDIGDGAAHVRGKGRGSGGKPRTIFYGVSTARALDRYLRARDRHPWAGRTDALWLGKAGPMTRFGLADMIERRCREAGIDHIHPHQFRHTFAHQWLADGGHETDLMRLTGWSSRSMLSRYAASAADARAAESYKKRQSPADRIKGGGK